MEETGLILKNSIEKMGKIEFNYEELKSEMLAKLDFYTNLVYTEEDIKVAKKDRAELNKERKKINDTRIALEKEYMAPFKEFKDKVAEILDIMDKSVAMVDTQVKAYEENQRKVKMATIEEIFKKERAKHENIGWLTLDKIMDARWLNVTESLDSIEKSISEKTRKISSDYETIGTMPMGFEAKELYKGCLDIGESIKRGKEIVDMQRRKEEEAKRRAEEEAKRAEEARRREAEKKGEPVDNGRWVNLSVHLTKAQEAELFAFLESKGIQYEGVSEAKENRSVGKE